MSYQIDFSDQALMDLDLYKKSNNKAILHKLLILLNQLSEHPYSGIGKPEALKHNLTGLWSRRINKEHRIVYEVLEESVIIHSMKGHY